MMYEDDPHANCLVCGKDLYFATDTDYGDDVYELPDADEYICADIRCLKAWADEHWRKELT